MSYNENDFKGAINGPTLIATIPYSAFTASTTLNYKIANVLTRNAKQRTFSVINQTNQSFDAKQLTIWLYDSITQNPSSVPAGVNGVSFGNNSTSPNGWSIGNGDQYGLLNSNVDSLFVGIPTSATAPTSGNVLVYVTEVI